MPLNFLSTVKRDLINEEASAFSLTPYAQRTALSSQDFFETIDERETTNGSPVVTKIDYDVVGAALGAIKRRNAMRARNPKPTADLVEAA